MKSFDFSQFECNGERNQETETFLLARSAAMASSSCKVFNLDVSSSISLGARTWKGGKGGGGGVREEVG